LFTDGADTAGLQSEAAAVGALQADAANQLLAVGLKSSPDFSPAAEAALSALAGNGQGLIPSDDPTTLERDFSALAARVAGQVRRTYLVGYCSPKRSGAHSVSIDIVGSTNQESATYDFNAAGFGPGCSATAFATACDGKQCGGLACGACDDTVDVCDGPTSTCVSQCSVARACGGATITNAQGYRQVCNDTPSSTSCGGACKDLRSDDAHCGACANACDLASEAKCIDGICGGCPAGRVACGNACVDTAVDINNCGACSRICTAGAGEIAMCVDGICRTAENFVTTSEPIPAMVQSAGTIFWLETNPGEVKKLSSSGGAPITLAAEGSPGALAVDATTVFWINLSGQPFAGAEPFRNVPIGGGTPTGGTPFTANFGSVSGMAVSSSYIYLCTQGVARRAPKPGGLLQLVYSIGGGACSGGIALDTNYVYWAAGTGVLRTSLSQPSVSTVVPGTLVSDVALAGASLVWRDAGAQSIRAAAVDGSNARTLAGATDQLGLATDGTSAYWLDAGYLKKVSLGGGSPIALAKAYNGSFSGFTAPSLAVDGTHVYWIDYQQTPRTFFIRRTAK
jgi:hypothetical protein